MNLSLWTTIAIIIVVGGILALAIFTGKVCDLSDRAEPMPEIDERTIGPEDQADFLKWMNESKP